MQKDARRVERLRGNAALTGATCIEARHADFLFTDPEAPEFAGIQAALLDPSCSGSGTAFTRMDYLLPSSADRLKGGWAGGQMGFERRQWQLATLAGKTARYPGQCLNNPYLAGPAWHSTRSTLHLCPVPPHPSTHPSGEEAIAYSDERVEALAQFQASCIRHALRFPALRRLVYSTCRCALGMLGTL